MSPPQHHHINPILREADLAREDGPTFEDWQWMGKPGSSLVAYPLPNQPTRTSSNCHFTQLLGTSALLGQLVSPDFMEFFTSYQEFCHLLWASVYIQTYNYIDDITLSDRFASENPRPKHLGISWHARKTAPEIEATATLIQATCADYNRTPIYDTVEAPVWPDFPTLPEEEQIREYWIIEEELNACSNNGWTYKPGQIIHRLVTSDTGDLNHLTFILAIVCKQRVISSARYKNFPHIDKLWQMLMEQYYRQRISNVKSLQSKELGEAVHVLPLILYWWMKRLAVCTTRNKPRHHGYCYSS